MNLKQRYHFVFLFFAIIVCNTLAVYGQTNYKDSLLHWIKNNPKIDSQYILTFHRLSYRTAENDVQESYNYYEKVKSLSDSLDFTYGKSLAQINLALLLSNSANYEGSNNAYFKAIEYAEACGALRLRAVSYNNVGENFKNIKNYSKCRQYTWEAIKINTQLKAWRGVAINYELLQQCDLGENLYTDAKKNLDSGMIFALMANDNYVLSQYYLGYGKLQALAGNNDSANYFFNKAMKQADFQNDLRNKFQVYMARSEYFKNLPPGRKIELLDSALAIARSTRYQKGILQAAEQLSNQYQTIQNKDSSLFYYRIFREANDSVFSENNRRNLVIKEADWLIKGKELENAHLKELSAIQKRDLIFKNALLITIGSLLLLIIAISIAINKNVQSKKIRMESELKQRIMEMQMQSLRAQMNPHFIFNCLNSIENFIMRNDKKAASEYLNKFSELIRIMLDSSRSELSSFSKNMEGIKLYVELEQLRFNHKFSFKSNLDPQLLNGDYKVPHLLIQPYIENAILHGLSQSEGKNLELLLSVRLKDDYIFYTIEDNGIGRKQSAKYKIQNKPDHKSVGVELSRERIHIFNHQHGAEGGVTISDLYDENNNPGGTRVQIKIKAV